MLRFIIPSFSPCFLSCKVLCYLNYEKYKVSQVRQLSAHRHLQHLWNHICHLLEALYSFSTELQQHCIPIVMYSTV